MRIPRVHWTYSRRMLQSVLSSEWTGDRRFVPMEINSIFALEILQNTARILSGTNERHVKVAPGRNFRGIQLDFYYHDEPINEMQRGLNATTGTAFDDSSVSSKELVEMNNLICAWSRWKAIEWFKEVLPSLIDRFRAACGSLQRIGSCNIATELRHRETTGMRHLAEAQVLCRVVRRVDGYESHVYAFVYKKGDERRIRMLLDINEVRVFAIFLDEKWLDGDDVDTGYFDMTWQRGRQMCFPCSSVWAVDFLTWVRNVQKTHTIAYNDSEVVKLLRSRVWAQVFRNADE